MKISTNIKRKKPSAFLTGLMMFTITTSCLSISNSWWKQVEAATSGESRIFNNTSTGRVGADTNNSTGTLGGGITISGGIYNWTVPESGTYSIEVWGAQGGASLNGSYAGGKGARMKGDFTLTKGTILKILVGQQGVAGQGGSGGGGTFITKSDNTALIVAGGGGGAHNNAGGNGVTTNSGTSGGIGTSYGAGGGGFSGNGTYATSDTNIKGGSAFTSGGQGGLDNRAASIHGGFGGGGGGMTGCSGGCAGGGGGGYNGGTPDGNAGAGGGSYNGGTNQSNTAGVKTGQGQAVITFVSPSVKSMAPASATKIQTNYVDVSWVGAVSSDATVTKYEIRAGTTSSGTNILALTNKGTTATQRLTVPTGMLGNTTIYWQVRVTDSKGRVGPWKESTVIFTNNIPMITATTNTPAKIDVSLDKRNHAFSITSLKEMDDFNYVSLFADVLDKNGNVVANSKRQIMLDSSLVSSAQLISGTATEKDGSLQGPFDHKTPFNLKLSLQPNYLTKKNEHAVRKGDTLYGLAITYKTTVDELKKLNNLKSDVIQIGQKLIVVSGSSIQEPLKGAYDLILTKEDGVTNVLKSERKLITSRLMQTIAEAAPESYTLRIYPEDRQNTSALSTSPLAGIGAVTPILIPFTIDTRNYIPSLTNVKHDIAKRKLSYAEGFNRISVSGHVDDINGTDNVTLYYEVKPKASTYNIDPKNGKAVKVIQPKVNHDFAFTYQVDSSLKSGNYALLVYGYDAKKGLGDYVEVPFTVNLTAPTIDFVGDYVASDGKTMTMLTSKKQLVTQESKVKLYFTPKNYATFEYTGYLIRSGVVKDLRIRGAFSNKVKSSFIGVDLEQSPVTLTNGEKTDFKLNDIVVFQFKATSAAGIVTTEDVRILIGNDASDFTKLDNSNLPTIN